MQVLHVLYRWDQFISMAFFGNRTTEFRIQRRHIPWKSVINQRLSQITSVDTSLYTLGTICTQNGYMFDCECVPSGVIITQMENTVIGRCITTSYDNVGKQKWGCNRILRGKM